MPPQRARQNIQVGSELSIESINLILREFGLECTPNAIDILRYHTNNYLYDIHESMRSRLKRVAHLLDFVDAFSKSRHLSDCKSRNRKY